MNIGKLKSLIADMDDDMKVVTMGADGTHIEYYPLGVAKEITIINRVEPHRGRYENNPVMRRSEDWSDGVYEQVFLVDHN